MRICPFLLGLTLVATPPLWAQQLTGEGTCGNPEVVQEIPIGDRPNHSFSVSKTPCSWTKPVEVAGQRSEGGNGVQVDERDGNISRYRGHYLDRMSGGDTVHYQYEGVAKFTGQTPQSATWNWTIVKGTGKLKGLTGKGNCKGSWPEGTYRWTCTGRYRLAK